MGRPKPGSSKERKDRLTICEGDNDDEDMSVARLQTLLKDRLEVEAQQVDADIVSKYLTELIDYEMIQNIELETNIYALAKSGVKPSVIGKEIRTFIALH
ncbi:hypothetical protein RRG08_047458 [Elysia crispata]|uniref:Uncharacterized protein n=1 Tax=Elysia crispata TaxID=231223 RepID=A0AAE0YUI1_9GAST|nr:hypothetical protein RRG08_047458 [Elysia crispata]